MCSELYLMIITILIHHLSYSFHQPIIRRQPLHTVKLIFREPACLLRLQQNQLPLYDFTPEALHRQMKVSIIILDCFDQSAAEHRVVKVSTTFEKPDAFYPVANGLWIGDLGTASNFV